MADGEGTESGTESSAESAQTQSESRTEQSGTSSTDSSNEAVTAALGTVNEGLKGLTEMVGKLPETLANLVKVEEKTDPPKTEGTPGQEPPKEEKPEAPKDNRNWFQKKWYGNG